MRAALCVGSSIGTSTEMAIDLNRVFEHQYGVIQSLVAAEDWPAACERLKSIRTVRPFIARQISRNVHPLYGSLVFQSAENSRSNEFLICLLECGADPDQRDCSGMHILMYCMTARRSTVDSNFNLFELLLASGSNPNAIADIVSGWPLLHWAVLNGKKEFIHILLQYGADPEWIVDGHDAFTLARLEQHTAIQEILAGWTEAYFDWMHE